MKGGKNRDQLNPGVHVEFEHVGILWNPIMCFYIFNNFNLTLLRHLITSVSFLKPTGIQEIGLLRTPSLENVFIWQRHLVNFFNKYPQYCLDILKENKWPHSALLSSNYPINSQWIIYSFYHLVHHIMWWISLIKLTKHNLLL